MQNNNFAQNTLVSNNPNIENAERVKSLYENENIVKIFSDEMHSIGLLSTERKLINQYIAPGCAIIDAGCGSGRVSFGLSDLGFNNILGYDFSDAMIHSCKQLVEHEKRNIEFRVLNSCDLSDLKSETYDACIYAYCGLLMIPGSENRIKALTEINRILKSGSVFMFDAYDRENPSFLLYWEEERDRWNKGEQDTRLNEFGDIIYHDKRSSGEKESYVHVPLMNEMKAILRQTGYRILYTAMRSDICEESELIKNRFGESRYWVCEKI